MKICYLLLYIITDYIKSVGSFEIIKTFLVVKLIIRSSYFINCKSKYQMVLGMGYLIIFLKFPPYFLPMAFDCCLIKYI